MKKDMMTVINGASYGAILGSSFLFGCAAARPDALFFVIAAVNLAAGVVGAIVTHKKGWPF